MIDCYLPHNNFKNSNFESAKFHNCNLQFSCTIEIELPLTAIPHDQLSSLVGERIGLLNMDGELLLFLQTIFIMESKQLLKMDYFFVLTAKTVIIGAQYQ